MAAPTESKNFSSLTVLAAAPASTDELYIQDVSETVATDKPKRITFANLTTNLQPLDAGLTDIAALAVTDGNFIVGNGANWVAESGATAIASLGLDADLATFALPASTTISAFGATLVDDSNAAAAIATLGLDADIATFALPASTTISAFGATLVDDTTAAAARTTLGIENGRVYLLTQNAVAVGIAPSGTMGANGAVTLGTALDRIYSVGLYLYFPAGAVYSGSAAGFYWAVMSSTTVGTVYNNIYTPGTNSPDVLSSPTAVSDAGPGAYTGVITEVTARQVTVPANSLGINGSVVIKTMYRHVNNSSTKTTRNKLAGSNFGVVTTATTTTGLGAVGTIYNMGRTNAQTAIPSGSDIFTGGSAASSTAAVDTTADTTVGASIQMATATDYVISQAFCVTICHMD